MKNGQLQRRWLNTVTSINLPRTSIDLTQLNTEKHEINFKKF
jgi:hypothetical protein